MFSFVQCQLNKYESVCTLNKGMGELNLTILAYYRYRALLESQFHSARDVDFSHIISS